MKRIASLILALGLSLAAFAQNAPVKGIVLDESQQPIIGAFVVEQGTSNGTVTGADGDFTLRVANGAVLEISCIGYVSQTIAADPNRTLEIILQEDSEMLEETVVIGYLRRPEGPVTEPSRQYAAGYDLRRTGHSDLRRPGCQLHGDRPRYRFHQPRVSPLYS